AGNSISFTFTLRAGNEEGLFYPRFILEMSDGTTLRYVIPVQVENSDLILSVIKKPDYVNIGKTATYTFEIGNPRPNAVNSVQVIPEGQGFQVTPTRYFIGNLDSDSTARVSFDVVPERVTQLRFKVLFKNGMNEHQFSIMVPIVPSENKKAAEIQLTNIAIVQEGDRFRLTGDVCNVGLERANAVIIMTEDPAIPVDPFRTYIVGTLEPDDFSSFELTFKASGNARIPVIAEYKDDEGNRISSITFVDISVAQFIESGSQPSTIGLILVWVLVIVVIVAIVYSWRRR
ncbi:hypothetical protein, partial [Methanothrix sp.]|uniref:hypothetical protein n=1 Tax=Methanothrix sp. TaxID=90426 RepID=UPI0034E26D16